MSEIFLFHELDTGSAKAGLRLAHPLVRLVSGGVAKTVTVGLARSACFEALSLCHYIYGPRDIRIQECGERSFAMQTSNKASYCSLEDRFKDRCNPWITKKKHWKTERIPTSTSHFQMSQCTKGQGNTNGKQVTHK